MNHAFSGYHTARRHRVYQESMRNSIRNRKNMLKISQVFHLTVFLFLHSFPLSCISTFTQVFCIHVLFSSLFFVWTFIVWFWLRICLMVTRISIKFRDDKTKITLFLYFWNFVCYWVTTQCLLFLCINCKDGYNSFVALIHTTAD